MFLQLLYPRLRPPKKIFQFVNTSEATFLENFSRFVLLFIVLMLCSLFDLEATFPIFLSSFVPVLIISNCTRINEQNNRYNNDAFNKTNGHN